MNKKLPFDVSTEQGKLEFLSTVPVFAGLSQAALAALARDFRVRQVEKNGVIFHQGDEQTQVYVVVDGKVRIYKISPGGNETSINISSTGTLTGEFAALDGRPRSASATALTRCVLLEMPGARFMSHLERQPGLALRISRQLTEKIRMTANFAETIAQQDAAGRLLHILLLYNEVFGREIEPGKRYALDLALNQSDLASLVGTRREQINRILRDWHKRGLIEYNGSEIIFLDLPRARRESALLAA
jgi:CRP/FNR family cyclic AMP-dependent transcriptional regulator